MNECGNLSSNGFQWKTYIVLIFQHITSMQKSQNNVNFSQRLRMWKVNTMCVFHQNPFYGLYPHSINDLFLRVYIRRLLSTSSSFYRDKLQPHSKLSGIVLKQFFLRWPFCISPMGSLQRGMQISKKLVRIAIRRIPIFRITIDTILQIFAYPCAKRYADFIGFSGEPHLNTQQVSLNRTAGKYSSHDIHLFYL